MSARPFAPRLFNSPAGDRCSRKNKAVRKKVEIAVQPLALAGIHAHAVHGVRLEEQRRAAQFRHWLEVFENDKWLAYDPDTGAREIPDDTLAWWRGMGDMVEAVNVQRLQISVSVLRSEEAALELAVEKGIIKKPLLLEFSLFSLPVQT